ncbi:1-deoxy-D-xylulose-5-phosphate synthase [Prevotella sp. HUN102]|uniref:1-deoxy-D-xylulose-5-phosphate synthase n=1 Tax=Prevotella sp. HUN102 TaxID=1392486 RepID=UPI00048CC072|nr:1-deoxy-D-xylulose-5-phosphate synthase [Prevotella sp. HUN102]
MYIEKIDSPKDLKDLSIEQLSVLADEVRAGVLNRVSNHGGHVGPNLGFTEATVALHYVFNAPEDKIVFDISHQSYPHKMLTGRKEGFLDVSKINSISGYSSPLESPEYDNFEIGHTSTSVALASGLIKGRDILGGTENVIAVIGDGSLSGGEAFEGLDTVGELGTNAIIIVNDNEMSIAENHGGLYGHLRELRESKGLCANNYFKTLGFDYTYLEEGNDVGKLIEAFQKVKDIDHPIVVHIHTEKGHGYAPAVADKESWHWNFPFNLEDGSPKKQRGSGEYIPQMLGKWLFEETKRDPKLVCISAGVPAILGFNEEIRTKMGKQHIDVGIAEEEAVALASGMAKRGAHPVFTTHATFMQRTYDQLCQDLAVNGNPAVINVTGSSIYGMNDFTHICFFDIPMISHIPNLVYLAPTTYEELIAMESWAIRQEQYSVAIRVPEYGAHHAKEPVDTDYSDLNKFKVAHRGNTVAVVAAGDFYQKGEAVVKALQTDGIDATLINPRYLSGIDEALLEDLKKDHQLVATIEDGSLDGGFGERIARFYGPSDVKVLCFGVKKQLYDRYDVEEVLRENHLTDEQIVEDIKRIIK